MKLQEALRVANRVLEEGHSYKAVVSVEGDAESGPYALDYYGYRFGQLKVEMMPNGTVVLYAVNRKSLFPRFWHTICSSREDHQDPLRRKFYDALMKVRKEDFNKLYMSGFDNDEDLEVFDETDERKIYGHNYE